MSIDILFKRMLVSPLRVRYKPPLQPHARRFWGSVIISSIIDWRSVELKFTQTGIPDEARVLATKFNTSEVAQAIVENM